MFSSRPFAPASCISEATSIQPRSLVTLRLAMIGMSTAALALRTATMGFFNVRPM